MWLPLPTAATEWPRLVGVVSPTELAAVALFADLEERQLGEVAGWFEERTVDSGTRLTGEGAAGYTFYVLVDGAAAVTSGERTLATLGPGDFFGERAILGDGRRTATVTTTEPSRVLVMFGTEFRRLVEAEPAIARAITASVQERLAAA